MVSPIRGVSLIGQAMLFTSFADHHYFSLLPHPGNFGVALLGILRETGGWQTMPATPNSTLV